MQISWNGLGSFVITGKPIAGEVSLVTDPYQNETGLRFPRTLSASLVIQSHESEISNNLGAIASPEDKKTFVVHHAGEYEVSGVFVTGVNTPLKDGTTHTIYRIELEDISVGFLGALDRELTDKEMEYLGAIDVLIVPACGGTVLSAKVAATVVGQIEPRLVIPSHIQVDGLKLKFDSEDAFVKELGATKEEMNKLKITKGALPQEDMGVIVLSRS